MTSPRFSSWIRILAGAIAFQTAVSSAFAQSQSPSREPTQEDPKKIQQNRVHVTGVGALAGGAGSAGGYLDLRKAARLRREAGGYKAYSTAKRLDVIPSALSPERIAALERMAGSEGVIEIRYQAPLKPSADPTTNLRHRLTEREKLLSRASADAESLSKKQSKLKEKIDLQTGNSRTSTEFFHASRQVRQLEEKEFLIRLRSQHTTAEGRYPLADELKQCQSELARARGNRLAKLASLQASKTSALIEQLEKWEKAMLGKRKDIVGNRHEIQRLKTAIRDFRAIPARDLASKKITEFLKIRLSEGRSLERTLEILRSQGGIAEEIRVFNSKTLREAAHYRWSGKAWLVGSGALITFVGWNWYQTDQKLKNIREDLKKPSASSLPPVYAPASRSGAVE